MSSDNKFRRYTYQKKEVEKTIMQLTTKHLKDENDEISTKLQLQLKYLVKGQQNIFGWCCHHPDDSERGKWNGGSGQCCE